MLKKIHDKADNTMGIVVSISGFSETAVSEASGPRTPVLLMDHRHLYLALGGTVTFGEIVERVRRHASQTGEALLGPDRFGGLWRVAKMRSAGSSQRSDAAHRVITPRVKMARLGEVFSDAHSPRASVR